MTEPRARFVQTTVEVEGRTESRVVEMPAFEPAPWTADTPLAIVGTSATRVDAYEKVTGRARYTADIVRPGMLHAVIVRSPIARGTLTALDLDAARAVPGVRGVMGPGDAPAGTRLFRTDVGYAGQPLAAVCADSLDAATRAARVVTRSLRFDLAPHAVTVDDAIAPGAPAVRSDKPNASDPDVTERGDIARGLAEADVTLTREYRTQVALHSALEPHGAVCEWTGDHLTVWESTQGIFRVRSDVAKALGVPQARVRVLKDYMGGGFGAKNGAGAHTFTAALFARALGAPVRCINDREAEQTDSGNRPATVQKVIIAARRDGTLTALVLDALVPLGISGWEGGPGQIYHELYACPNVRTSETWVYINASGMQAFRGPGYVEGAFGLEGAMNALARELGMDPVALRLKNLATRDQRADRPFSGNRLDECYAEGMKRFGWTAADRHPPSAPHLKRGIGVAAQTWPTGGGPPSYALVRINSDASVDVLAGTQDLGTGSRTIFAQIAAEALGARLDTVRAVIGDTERLPYTGNSWGSMTTPSVGPAVRMAAEDARMHLLEAAAQLMDLPVDTLRAEGSMVRSSSGASMSFADVCKRLGNVQIVGRGSRGPNPAGVAIVTVGVQFVEVEVDAETGVVRVLRVVAVHDAGRIINPALAESQMHGGIIQGVGYALFEERHIDRTSGVPLNTSLHDYKVPTMLDVPAIDASFLSGSDTVANHVGARGIAEPPIIPTAPAIAAAVADALGVEVRQIPLTPWRVLGALAE